MLGEGQPPVWFSGSNIDARIFTERRHLESGMNWSIIRSLGIATLIAYPVAAIGADQAPDVKGKWIGKTNTILVGKGAHWPKGRGTWDKPALLEKDLVIDITGQDGRRFWGVTTLSGAGQKTDEPFIGSLAGKDNKSFVFSDTDGFWNGQLDDNDTLSFCYTHTGGKTTSTVVSCTEVKRAR
jgi:hypothetical protein